MSACNSEKMVVIGAELPKLSKNKTGYPFFGPPCTVYTTKMAQRVLDSEIV